jgi:hypothetical protein
MNVKLCPSYVVLFADDKEQWSVYLKSCCYFDFYHTWDYHTMEKEGEPLLFVYLQEPYFIALPLIKRTIEGTSFYDCTSAYGYTGPISNLEFEKMNKRLIEGFQESLIDFFRSNQIVTVFSRLHPLFNQQLLFEGLGGLYRNGETVAIDLSLSIEEQRLKYRKTLRQKINQLRKKGFVVKESATEAEVKAFSEIYTESMKKLNAASHYFFYQGFFEDFIQKRDFVSKLLLCYYEGEITSGILLTFSGHIAQIHLAATTAKFLHESPMKLLFDEASLISRNLNMNYLHLGSGVGGEEGSLFYFKSGFSDRRFDFFTWRYIADTIVYDKLIDDRKQNQNKEYVNTLFPLYRFI